MYNEIIGQAVDRHDKTLMSLNFISMNLTILIN